MIRSAAYEKAPPSETEGQAMPHKVILDTDIGYRTDADDALALAYLLVRPDCELIGVTTVGLHSSWRAELADGICAELGRPDVPIAAGADRPLYATTYWRENPVRRMPSNCGPQPTRMYEPGRAVKLLGELIRRHPNEITLITIGQFTNLAMLLLTDPEAAGLLKAIVSMGGRMDHPPDRPETECNAMLDPVAAGVVFQRVAAPFTLLPIGPVRGTRFEDFMLEEMLADERFGVVRVCCGAWEASKGISHVGLADPVACAIAFEPDLAECERGRAVMRLFDHPLPDGEPFAGGEAVGATAFETDAEGPHCVVRKVRREDARDRIRSVFSGDR